SAVMGIARRLLVGIGRGNAVGQHGWTLVDLALLVGNVVHLVIVAGKRLDGRLRERRPARLHEVAEVQASDAMAALANLCIDLETALQLRFVKLAEGAAKRPRLALDMRLLARRP